MKKPRVSWLNRELLVGPFLCLVRNKAEWADAFRHVGVDPEPFPSSVGRCTWLRNTEGELCCIVLIQGTDGRTPIEVAGLIVHEAVHVVQGFMEDIGETKPSDEFQAYAIQIVAQRLMAAWCGQEHA